MNFLLGPILIFLASGLNVYADNCQWKSIPAVLEKSDSHLVQYWEFKDSSYPLTKPGGTLD